MNMYHVPVMLTEVIENLCPKFEGVYIDCNLGSGGHTKEILRRGGKVLGIDADSEAITEVRNWIGKTNEKNLTLVQGNFSEIMKLAKEKGFNNVDGILFDLGLSSHQLETAERGFSFTKDAPLDMRMSSELTVTAGDLINGLNTGELDKLFSNYGEEKFARQIAKAIIERRNTKEIRGTQELAEIIKSARPRGIKDHTHPATRVFQALRIAVNDELHSLEKSLPQATDLLRPGGRIVVISFHSLEDRIVKLFMKKGGSVGLLKVLSDKPITPSSKEVINNPRARSAKMRVAEKR
jgi:16S rRNA (cytosine1402-N4)-methyltransferase